MPSHAPNHFQMSPFYLVQHAIFTRSLSQPINYLATVRRTGKQFFFVGVPGYDGHLIIMPFETIQLRVCFPYIEHFYFLVAATSQKPIPIDWIPPDLINDVIVRVNLVDPFATNSWIPQLDMLVLARGENE